jgi:DMSO/TMAO reductase YedYZ molybdopterin-dependent catalytic subunit
VIQRTILCFAFCAGLVFAQAPAIAVGGDVSSPLKLTADDLAKMPRATATIPDPKGNNVVYEGVALRELLKRAGAPTGKDLRGKALTTYVLARAHDGYQVLFSLGEIDEQFGNESILVADKRDGKPLEGNQGPFRLVCPNDKEGARSVRMLEAIDVMRVSK